MGDEEVVREALTTVPLLAAKVRSARHVAREAEELGSVRIADSSRPMNAHQRCPAVRGRGLPEIHLAQ